MFTDRKLPDTDYLFSPGVSDQTHRDYYTELHRAVSASGQDYPAGTPNCEGARIPLTHSKLNIAAWIDVVPDTNPRLLDYLMFGFPLGLDPNFRIESTLKNHSSSYMYYNYVDKFVSTELKEGGIIGPFHSVPMDNINISPLMTAHKNPCSRRIVFDTPIGDHSLNNNTPKDTYRGAPTEYDFPSVDTLEEMVLRAGKGALMWKRDLSRYYLQLPLDPVEYNKTSFIWRQQLFIFIGLMFGLRHSGLAGQQVTTAITQAHNKAGTKLEPYTEFNSVNYCDDLGGVEVGVRAWLSFYMIAVLLKELGLAESEPKASPPSTDMIYLGVRFDSVSLRKSVPPEKLAVLVDLLEKWSRKVKAGKKDLQSIVGKLMWVAKIVRHSRVFVCRLLAELKRLHHVPPGSKVVLTTEVKKDILWWKVFLRTFNGVEFMIPTTISDISMIYAGDACLSGGGAYYDSEYWSRTLPVKLIGSPIHVLEFWVIIASIVIWGPSWAGNRVIMYCDNDSCCDVINYGRPKDSVMVDLFREFTYRVCKFKFTPVVKKISTEDNFIADFVSRNHSEADHCVFFEANDIRVKCKVEARDDLFLYSASW